MAQALVCVLLKLLTVKHFSAWLFLSLSLFLWCFVFGCIMYVRMRPCVGEMQEIHCFPLCSCYCCQCSCAVSGQSTSLSPSISLSFFLFVYLFIYSFIYLSIYLLCQIRSKFTMHTVWDFFFYPLLILYICPLTKKWSVYNFNGRFIWTVRDRITTKNPEIRISKSYKLICILMSQTSIWSPIKQQDIWLPGVCYAGEDLRLGALS